MLKQVVFLSVLIIFALPLALMSQSLLNGPSHASYDIVTGQYFISNWNTGTIVTIDNLGEQSLFVGGLGHVFGNYVADNTLFVSNGSSVRAYRVSDGEFLWAVSEVGDVRLDGLITDNSGYLYMTKYGADGIGSILRLRLSDQYIEEYVGSGLPQCPEDMIFDETNNRLLVACYDDQAPIVAVDLSDASVSIFRTTTFGYCTGIAADNDGYIYVSSHTGNAVYRFDQYPENPPILFADGFLNAGGICYNPDDHILAVPNYSTNSVIFLDLNDDDEDTILNYDDNCIDDYNPDQSDADADHVGNVCDNCINHPNYYQQDSDGDEAGDACDNCPDESNPSQDDPDGDNVGTVCDNCPYHYNPQQEDYDGDNIGNICDFICGDFDNDQNINILDIVYLINFLYKSGAAPSPPDKMDVNFDGNLNILDIVYIINFVYKNGPEPECTPWLLK